MRQHRLGRACRVRLVACLVNDEVGSIPSAWTERSAGVRSAVVITMAPSPPSGTTDCTESLPKERVPTMAARPWSCSAPTTISLAEGMAPFTSTTIGTLPAISSPVAAKAASSA